MQRQIVALILITFFVGRLQAQKSVGNAKAISSSSTGVGKVYHANRNEPARAIEFNERTVSAAHFITNINHYFNIPAEFTFTEVEFNTDNIGMRHRLLQQNYKGVPVEGMGYRVHERDGFITSANGKAVRDINLETHVILTEEQAFQLAVKHLQTMDTTYRKGIKSIVSKDFTFTSESFAIGYQFDIDVSLIERWRISIDARDGSVINKVSLVNTCFHGKEPPLPYGTGKGVTNYYGTRTVQVERLGNGSRLVGQTENGGKIGTFDFRNVNVISLFLFYQFHKVYDFTSGDNTYNDPYYTPAISVQWAAEQAYEYYFKKHSRNSFDNNGSAIRSYVHIGAYPDNAFWNGKIMGFGNSLNYNPLVELDVVSHELTHGVTQHEAGLQYFNEYGALNESFSDIMSKAVEFYTFGDTATWQLARHSRSGGMRDFSNPNLRNQPDTYLGDRWFTGLEDNGGIHYNSGVQNFWFYLLCEGGSGVNDHQVSYAVNAIGIEAATNIAYRNLTEYLGQYSDYLDSRIGSLLATADLYGKNSAIYQQVDKAWDAVGVIDEPIITNLEVYGITATTVKIKGSLLPRGETVTYHFEYGTTPAFGISSSVYHYTDEVKGMLTGLQSQTKYYFRLVATNENGNTFYNSEFTTISLAPLVKIKQTVDVTETTAVLYGEINPNSLPTSFYFEYGLTPALGMVTATYPLSDTTEFLQISASVKDLQPRQNYYYKLVGINNFASTETESVTFFTAVKPIVNTYTPVSGPIDTEITISGQNFNTIPEKNSVSFGATRGSVLSATATEIKVKVPPGASLGTISVLDLESGLTAESVREFVPTFTGAFEKGGLQLRVGVNEPYIYRALVQDMDGDNKPDIVASHYNGFSVFQNVNQGGDITEESFVRNTYPRPSNYSNIYLVDFDGNGLKDVVVPYKDGVRIYQNFSVPGFIFFGVPVDVPTGNLRALTFNDFDQDGHMDIAGIIPLSYQRQILTVIRNQNPKGSLSAGNFDQRSVMIVPYQGDLLTSGDLNNDGKPDLMVSTYGGEFLSILKNSSRPGAFEFEENIVQDTTRESWVRYVAHDLNQDGWKDVISHSPHLDANLAIFENESTSANIKLASPVVTLKDIKATNIQPGDMNGDNRVDLLVSTGNRTFLFLENKVETDDNLSSSSFEKFDEFGVRVSGNVDAKLTINDLNGDGRPDVVVVNSYYYGPNDGYNMEIWQNSPNDCLDPSPITLNVSKFSATIVLPPNTTLDDFEIEYSSTSATYWWQTYSTTLSNLSSGSAYKLRARAKCYLGYTNYHYINFTTECVDLNSFAITSIGINNVTITALELYTFEVQYSLAGKNQWQTLSQYTNTISNLLPGTNYDLRFRGACFTPTDFEYKQFTTLCPQLTTLSISDLTYNKAVVRWTSNYTGSAILEYSIDNTSWTSADEAGTMFPLMQGKKYFVRGRLACTDINSDFIYNTFTTLCPSVSTLSVDTITPFSAKLNWVDESQTGSYTLTYSYPVGQVKTIETNLTTFTLVGLNPGTAYAVAIAPQCMGTKSYTYSTFNTVCYVPFNLSVNSVTQTTAELSWRDNFSGFPYFVDYSVSGGNVWHTTESELTNVLLTELRPGAQYEARVHIQCLSVIAPYASVRFNTELYQETTLAPNPTDNNITISPAKNLIGNRYSIYDNTGRRVVNDELLTYIIDLSNVSAGMYILMIEGEKPMRIIKR